MICNVAVRTEDDVCKMPNVYCLAQGRQSVNARQY